MRTVIWMVALLLWTGCTQQTAQIESEEDLATFRQTLRAEVASGKLSEEQAIVALAKAQQQLKGSARKKKAGSKRNAFGQKLKERVANGELSSEDAVKEWEEISKKFESEEKKNASDLKQK